METIKLTTHVGTDGLLKIEIPLEITDSDLEVEISVRPLAVTGDATEAWPPGYFEQTAGALADDPLVRAPQGGYEQREPIR